MEYQTGSPKYLDTWTVDERANQEEIPVFLFLREKLVVSSFAYDVREGEGANRGRCQHCCVSSVNIEAEWRMLRAQRPL